MAIRDSIKKFGKNVKGVMNWFGKTNKEKSQRNPDRRKVQFDSAPQIGRMYLYDYFPKGAKTLPYYDLSPLTIVIEKYNDGFLGLNLHYLEPRLRLQLLEALEKYTTGQNENRRLQVSYQILKGASSARAFKPCVKRYLYSQVKSRFARIDPENWGRVVLLPLARFRKATQTQVWSDSRKRI